MEKPREFLYLNREVVSYIEICIFVFIVVICILQEKASSVVTSD